MSPRSVTKTNGTISREGFCKACGKALPASTRRRVFCNDSCRQTAYRHTTGKSAKAGTLRVKTEIPTFAKLGRPKTAADREWFIHEVRLLRQALAARCYGGVIEVYHHKFGRGVLDLFRPFNSYLSLRLDRGPLYALSGYPSPELVWSQARCQFNKPKLWHMLDWREVWLLGWHDKGNMPANLKWVHTDSNRRVRRSRFVRLGNLDVGWDQQNGCYVLFSNPSVGRGGNFDLNAVANELTEETGKHHDDQTPIRLDTANLPDAKRRSGRE